MSSAGGRVVGRAEYDPWGRQLSQFGMMPGDYSFVGAYGVRQISDTKFVMGVRHYDAEVGRFLSEDPIGLQGGDVNLYRYVGNNSVRWNDPTGEKNFTGTLFPITSFGRIAWGVGFGVATIHDTVCGDTTEYSHIVFGLAVGSPIGLSSRLDFSFEGSSKQRSWSFEGAGAIGTIFSGGCGKLGYSYNIRLHIPNVPKTITIKGGFIDTYLEAGSYLYLTMWKKRL